MASRQQQKKSAGKPARRWYRRAELEPDDQGFTDPDDLAHAAARLIHRIESDHPELKRRPGLWGARISYVEESATRKDGSPVWDPEDEMKGYNVKLSTRDRVVEELKRTGRFAHTRLTGQTKRRSIRGVAVYVYPDSSPWSKRDHRKAAGGEPQAAKPHQPGPRRDKFGQFWSGERVPTAPKRDKFGRFIPKRKPKKAAPKKQQKKAAKRAPKKGKKK